MARISKQAEIEALRKTLDRANQTVRAEEDKNAVLRREIASLKAVVMALTTPVGDPAVEVPVETKTEAPLSWKELSDIARRYAVKHNCTTQVKDGVAQMFDRVSHKWHTIS